MITVDVLLLLQLCGVCLKMLTFIRLVYQVLMFFYEQKEKIHFED